MLGFLKLLVFALAHPLKVFVGCRNTVLFPFRSFGIAIKVLCAYFYLIFFSFNLTGVFEQLPDVLMALVFVFGAHLNPLLYLVLPTVQNFRNVKLGLVGMCFCVWTTMLSIFLHQNGHLVASRCLYHGLFFIFTGFFLCFENSHSRAVIEIPDEKRPFTEFKSHVILLGVLHLIAAALMLIVFNQYLVCSFLLYSSFIFTVEAYSVLTLDSYMICLHDQFSWPVRYDRKIICHVNMKPTRKRSASDGDLPAGFVYKDELKKLGPLDVLVIFCVLVYC